MALGTLDQLGCPSGLSAPAEPESRFAALAPFVRRDAEGHDTLELMVEGASCASCIKKIERSLLALPGVADARLNLSTKRLRVSWAPGALAPETVAETLNRVGYQAAPFDPELAQQNVDAEGRFLLRCLAVAGFGAMNIMMFTTPIWFGDDMGGNARTLLHWFSALVAVPTGLYAAQPFFRSAWSAPSSWASEYGRTDLARRRVDLRHEYRRDHARWSAHVLRRHHDVALLPVGRALSRSQAA